MDIGKESPAKIVTPLEEPVPERQRRTAPARAPKRAPRRTPAKTPAKTPEKVPAR